MTDFIEQLKQTKRWRRFEAWSVENTLMPYWKLVEYGFLLQQGVFLEYLRSEGIQIDVCHSKLDSGQVQEYVFTIV